MRQFSIDQTALDPTTNRGGVLIGDSLVRGLELQMQQALATAYEFGDNTLTSLSQLGVSFDREGLLTLDAGELAAALDEDPNAVRQVLSGVGESDGAASAIARFLEPVVRTGDGLMTERDAALADRIDDIDSQIVRFEDRLALREEALIRQFSALESLVSTLQAQSGFLTGFGNAGG